MTDDVLQARARQLSRPRGAPPPAGVAVLHWEIDAQTYAIELAMVVTVITAPPMSRLPQAPRHIPGVLWLLGRPVPLLDLSLVCGGPQMSGAPQVVVVAGPAEAPYALPAGAPPRPAFANPPHEIQSTEASEMSERAAGTPVRWVAPDGRMLLDAARLHMVARLSETDPA